MINEENLKNRYQSSEDSVPVNEALKNRLVEMAKACEHGETVEAVEAIEEKPVQIRRIDARKKNHTRNMIIKMTALAACLAVCVCSIPSFTDKYFNQNGGDDMIRSAAATETPSGNTDRTEPNAQTAETTDEKTGENAELPDRAEKPAENKTEVKSGQINTAVPSVKKQNTQNTRKTETRTAAVSAVSPTEKNASAAAAVSAASPVENLSPEADGKTAGTEPLAAEEAPEPDSLSAVSAQSAQEIEGGDPEPGGVKSVDTEEEILESRDAFNQCLTMLGRQRTKLDAWDQELRSYAGRDTVLDASYAEFGERKMAYEKAADEYTAKYAAAGTERELQNGITEYDATLSDSSELYNKCRESYRKSTNYIEMSGINSQTENTEGNDEN